MTIADLESNTKPCTPPKRRSRARDATGVPRRYASGRADYLARLRNIEDQVRDLQRIVETDPYAPDIVIQISSATRALQEVAVGLLADRLHHCVVGAIGPSETKGTENLDEVTRATRHVIRL